MSNFKKINKEIEYLNKAIECMHNVIYSLDEDLSEYETEIDVNNLYEALKEIKDTSEDLENDIQNVEYELNNIL